MDSLVADRGKEGHFGLQGMRERVGRIAAKLTVTSSPESGTEIILVIPGETIYRKLISELNRTGVGQVGVELTGISPCARLSESVFAQPSSFN